MAQGWRSEDGLVDFMGYHTALLWAGGRLASAGKPSLKNRTAA